MMRFGVIGTSKIVDTFLEAASYCKDFELKAIYSRSKDKGQEFADKYRISNIYNSLEELAKSDDIDAVYIASPNSCHASQAILMMEHKKHVLCEKPIASNTRELEQMLKAAKENNVVLLEAMRSVFDPGFFKIQELLPKLGVIRRATFQFCQYSSRYDKFKNGEILNAFNPDLSNGALMDIGVYCVHAMTKLFGMPNSISANSIFLENGMEGAGTITASYDNMQAELIYSKITNSYLPSQIQGEEACMIISEIADITEIKIVYKDRREETISISKIKNNMYYELEEFINLIKSNQNSDKHNKYSIMQMKIMDEARRQTNIIYPADIEK